MKKILIAGGSGLIGRRLSLLLIAKGHEVGILTRSKNKADIIRYHQWDLNHNQIDKEINRYDYLVNLTGAGIADKPWSKKRKKEIINSRTNAIKLLHESFKVANKNLKGIVSASAIGYYGDSGDTMVTEESNPQSEDFLVETCEAWEEAAKVFEEITEKLCIVRIGTVLSKDGGALSKMSEPIKYGIGSYFGNGMQWMSWIHIDDICEMIIFLLEKEHKGGVVNGVSPEPVQNKAFSKLLINQVNRFSLFLPIPKLFIKTVFGEMSHLFFNSNKVSANKIQKLGYKFKYAEINKALDVIYN